jgi:uncharacterized protein (TIGR03437 family)
MTPAIKTAFAPSTTASVASLPRPVLPLSVTIGGVPAFVQFAGIGPGLIGTTQINVLVPSNTPLENQAVVVTVNGVASSAANVNIFP